MKRTWLVLLAIMFLAFVLRIYRIDFVSLRGDEAFTVVFVQRTWEGLWKGIRLIEPNPPLMYLLLRAWIVLAGASEFVTRYFSAFFGVLCVPLVYRLAQELFGKKEAENVGLTNLTPLASPPAPPLLKPNQLQERGMGGEAYAPTGLIAAFLMAINPYQIWHSQDVRNYTLWPALSMLSLIFFWMWWNRERQTAHGEVKTIGVLILYVIATTASLYTHYYDTFILVAENIFVFAVMGLGRHWRTLARWIGAQIVLAIVYLPWVLWGTNRVTTYGEASAQQSVPLLEQFSRTLATFVFGDTVPDYTKMAFWLPLALAIALSLIYLALSNRERALFVLLYIAIPTLALYAISLGRPLFLERYLNAIAPAYYLVFAAGMAALYQSKWLARISRLAIRVLPAACLLFFVTTSAYALSNYYFVPAYAKAPDWKALGQFITAHQQPGDVIVQNFNEMSAIYYQNNQLPLLTVPKDYYAIPSDEQTLEQLNKDYRRIWFIPAAPDSWDPNQFVERYLSRHDNLLIDTAFTPLRLQLYSTPVEFESGIIPVNSRIGKATLVGYQMQGSDGTGLTARSASNLQVRLYWRPLDKIANDLHVFVHLTGANEQVVAQQDGIPVNGIWATPDWLPGELIVDTYHLKWNAAPGTYALSAGMYDPATLARVPAFDRNGASLQDNNVPLTRITVIP